MTTTILEHILEAESLQIHFQPIVFPRKKTVLGFEALARAEDQEGRPVPPLRLFSLAQHENRMVELDRLCRKKAMLAFAQARPHFGPNSLLFVNFEASIIDQGVLGSGAILQAAEEAGLKPADIVIEINESKVRDLDALKDFVERHRSQGFLIALDDLGAGHSNITRVAGLKPNIIKLDRELIQGIDKDFVKQETVKSLALLARRIGSIILAEGTETEAEVDCSMDLGAELIQGYYFARPLPSSVLRPNALTGSIIDSSLRQKKRAVTLLGSRRREAQKQRRLLEQHLPLITESDPDGFDIVLQKLLGGFNQIECAYVINTMGIQCTPTLFDPRSKPNDSHLFSPAPKGADHSSKEYFYSLIDAGLERYTTEPYVSLATGSLCRTLSARFATRRGESFVLCLDLKDGESPLD